MTSPGYVRVCPICEAENPPALIHCACGAALGGVDFTLKRAPAGDGAASGPVSAASAQTQAPAATPDASSAIAAAATVCPHADCAQPNPPGQARCIYCNRPLEHHASTAPAAARPLPSALRDKYRYLEVFPASGAEADLLLVTDLRGGERRVVKLYRHGLKPDFKLLSLLAKAIGDAVVRVIEYGVSDGIAYEVLEFIEHGTLQELLRSGPLSSNDVRRIVQELADALNGIHEHHILHRDLKPENVLLRSKSPLELALADFGIATLTEATQHFTSGARTTRYAAPEVLTGVLDEKSDWWSLGMIALEAATGFHPFDGLSEQVMTHRLATRPIDVRGVYDDDLRRLCRGLLLRDPKRRWSSAEVQRWLNGDTTLAVPDDNEGPASAVRPYKIGTAECTSASELAIALARNWSTAAKDLARGQIAHWLEHELHDYDLLRQLQDIQDYRSLSDDARLLRFLLAAAPDLPTIWLGQPLNRAALLAAAHRAAAADESARSWLESLYREDVLAQFAAAGDIELKDIDHDWRKDWMRFLELWQTGRDAEEAWRKRPRPVAGLDSAEVVSFDDLVYTQAARLAPPAQRNVHGALLLARLAPDYGETLRGELLASLASIVGYCPWIETLWQKAQSEAVGLVVVQRILPRAREDAELEMRRLSASHDARARIVAEVEHALRERVNELLAIAPDDDHDFERATIASLLEALEPFQVACQRVIALGYTDPEYEKLRHNAQALSSYGSSLQHALAQCERVLATNAIFMRPTRLLMVAGVLVVATLLLREPWAVLVLLIGALTWLIQRWYAQFAAVGDALTKLGALRRYAQVFTRAAHATDTANAPAKN